MLFCWLTKMAVATIAINIYQDTTFGMEDHLTIAYAAAANYNTFPNYLWNSHVFTLRWPDSLGSNVICGMTDIHGFLYATDPGPRDSRKSPRSRSAAATVRISR